MNVVFCWSLAKIFADNKMWMQQSEKRWSDVPPFDSEMVATFSKAFLDFYMLFIAFVDDMFAVYDKKRLISAAFILREHFFSALVRLFFWQYNWMRMVTPNLAALHSLSVGRSVAKHLKMRRLLALFKFASIFD